MKERVKSMKKKGWSEKEIDKTLSMLAKNRSSEYERTSNRIIYWTVLLVLTISNFLVAVLLIPFLLVISTVKFYLLIITLGLIFGLLFDLLVRDIEHLKTKHHVFAAVFIPIIAVVNLFMMITIANRLADFLNIGITESPVFASFIYVLVFILPHIINLLREEFFQ
ncbi:hypothetical protein HQ529_02845 [Candidatus Woesearchaeota archaeon]|nr:hypothetical protein [Candidatus Woesearchaeota archaeon]